MIIIIIKPLKYKFSYNSIFLTLQQVVNKFSTLQYNVVIVIKIRFIAQLQDFIVFNHTNDLHKQVTQCILVMCLLSFIRAPPTLLSFWSFYHLFPTRSYFLLHAHYLSVPHSPIWQALSCARVTLASLLPQKVRQRTEKNPPTFHLFYSMCFCLSIPHTHTDTHARAHLSIKLFIVVVYFQSSVSCALVCS